MSPRRTTWRRHQRRALDIIQVAEGPGVMAPEVGVPHAALSIDSLLRIGAQPSSIWGPLRGTLAERLVVFEHHSEPPSLNDLASAEAKRALIVRRWLHDEPDKRFGARVPLLLVLSVGWPRTALRGLPQMVAGPLGGICLRC